MNAKQALKIIVDANLAPNFNRAFGSASGKIVGLGEEIDAIKKKQRLIQKIDIDSSSVSEAKKNLEAARASMKKLSDQLDKRPMEQLERDLSSASRKSKQLSESLGYNKNKLAEAKAAVKLLSIEMKEAPTQSLAAELQLATQEVTKFEQKVNQGKKELSAASDEVRKLKAAVKNTRDFEAATRKVDDLSGALKKKETSLQAVQDELSAAGVETRNYNLENERLKQTLDDVEKRQKSIASLSAKQQQLGRGVRNSALAFGGSMFGISQMMQSSIQDKSMTADIAITADLDDDQIKILEDKISELSGNKRTFQGARQLKLGVNEMVTQGLSFDEVLSQIEAVGLSATASSANIADMSKTAFSLKNNMNIVGKESQQAFDILVAGGKVGSFELKEMAKYLPAITADAKKLGLEGIGGVTTLTAALQTSMKTAGDPAEAANNMRNFLGKITAPETIKRFAKEYSVDIETEMKAAIEKGLDPMQYLVKRTMELTKGDEFRVGELFGDMQAKSFLTAMTQNQNYFEETKALLQRASGTSRADADRRFELDPALQLRMMNEQFSTLKSNLIAPLITPLTDLATALNGIVKPMADIAQKNPALVQGLMGLAAGGFLLKASFLALRLVGVTTMLSFLKKKKAVDALKLGMFGLGKALPIVATGLRVIGTALIANPIGAAITGIAIGATLIMTNWDKIKPFFVSMWDGTKRIFSSAFDAIKSAFLNFTPLGLVVKNWQPLMSYFQELPDKFASFGRAMMDGLRNGIEAKIKQVLGSVTGVADSISGKFKGFLRIKSPSRLFMQHGDFLMQGLSLGIERGQSLPLSNMKSLAGGLSGFFAASLLPANLAAEPVKITAPTHRLAPAITTTNLPSAPAVNNNQYEINIHVPEGADGQLIANVVREELERIERDKSLKTRATYYDSGGY